MTSESALAELELELTWRVEELKDLRNIVAVVSDNAVKEIYRKALVVMLYSHVEGFCKGALTVYVSFIINARLRLSEVEPAIAAIALDKLFSALGSGHVEDTGLGWRFDKTSVGVSEARFRRMEFVERWNEFLMGTCVLDAERVVDTESNLHASVLRKLLFSLALPTDVADRHSSALGRLVRDRNNFAHGIKKAGLSALEYEAVEGPILVAMSDIKAVVGDAIIRRVFERADPFVPGG